MDSADLRSSCALTARDRIDPAACADVGLKSRGVPTMARQQSKEQKETIERVMHEFKHGELRIRGTGPKVKNPAALHGSLRHPFRADMIRRRVTMKTQISASGGVGLGRGGRMCRVGATTSLPGAPLRTGRADCPASGSSLCRSVSHPLVMPVMAPPVQKASLGGAEDPVLDAP